MLLVVMAPLTPATAELIPGVVDEGEYGGRFGTNEHPNGYQDTFTGSDVDYSLRVTGYDIDDPEEVRVYLNDPDGASDDNLLGNLRVTRNLGRKNTRFIIPASAQNFGADNTITFIREGRGVVWGITNLLLEPVAGPVRPLEVGTPDPSAYGRRFGTNEHLGVVPFSFSLAETTDLVVKARGYDADTDDKIAVFLDGVEVGFMKNTGNRVLGKPTYLPLGNVSAGSHILEFRVNRPGRTYGIQRVTLIDADGPQIALNLGERDNGTYGFRYGDSEHLTGVVTTFTGTGSPLTLQVRGYDADNDDEIQVYLDGEPLPNGFLSRGRNNGLNSGDSIPIPGELATAGSHTLEFRQEKKLGNRYGVTQILLAEQGPTLGGGSSSGGDGGGSSSGGDDGGSSSGGDDGGSSSGGDDGGGSSSGGGGSSSSGGDDSGSSSGADDGGSSSGGDGSSSSGGDDGGSSSGGDDSGSSSGGDDGGSSSGGDDGGSSSGSSGGSSSGGIVSGIGPRTVAECNATSATTPDITIEPGDDAANIISSAPANTEFLIKSGEYRLADTIEPKNGQKLICETGAVFNGSVLLEGDWEPEGDLFVYTGAPFQRSFDGSRMQAGFEVNASTNDLYIDNRIYLRVDAKNKVNNDRLNAYDGRVIYYGTFYQEDDKLYVATDPSARKAEMSNTGEAIKVGFNVGDNVVVENCTIEKFASGDISAAIEIKQTRGWVLRNVVARLNHTGGLHAGGDTSVYCGRYIRNGQTGISTSLSDSPTDAAYADNLVVKGAEIAYNNWAHYAVQWHAGGLKFFLTDGVTVTDNHVHNNLGVGIWSDFDVRNSVFENNLVTDNLSRGIQIEASYGGSVQRNIVQCNTRDPAFSLDWAWFWGSQIFAKNTPEVEIAFNEIDVRDGQGIGVVDNNFRHVGRYGPQRALNNQVHDNTVSFADIPPPTGDGFYEFFFQRNGIESDGPPTTFGDGAMNCTPDSTLSQELSQAEITAAVAACNANGGIDATASEAGNSFYNNVYNYASEDVKHFRIRGVATGSNGIPSAWEVGSTFNVGSTGRLRNLCN